MLAASSALALPANGVPDHWHAGQWRAGNSSMTPDSLPLKPMSGWSARRTEHKRVATETGRSRAHVINLGLPKSGSSSLEDFFNCGGFSTSHFVCPRRTRDVTGDDNYCGHCECSAAEQKSTSTFESAALA